MSRPSLAYRNNRGAILRGDPPEKYRRILPFVGHGPRILELGSAEGVLSLMIAADPAVQSVIGIETRLDRHAEAVQLKQRWRELGYDVDKCTLLCNDIRERLDLLGEIDTLVAVRSIYYLRDDIWGFFRQVSLHVQNVVLSGNAGRARNYFQANGAPKDTLGRHNFYASLPGMVEVLAQNGYRVETTVADGDPIVVGTR